MTIINHPTQGKTNNKGQDDLNFIKLLIIHPRTNSQSTQYDNTKNLHTDIAICTASQQLHRAHSLQVLKAIGLHFGLV